MKTSFGSVGWFVQIRIFVRLVGTLVSSTFWHSVVHTATL
jgi:hypothetical protein